jgi:hypothetical protein
MNSTTADFESVIPSLKDMLYAFSTSTSKTLSAPLLLPVILSPHRYQTVKTNDEDEEVELIAISGPFSPHPSSSLHPSSPLPSSPTPYPSGLSFCDTTSVSITKTIVGAVGGRGKQHKFLLNSI